MFGTIGHARVKSGHNDQLNDLIQGRKCTVRSKVAGTFLEIAGYRAGEPDEIVFLALAQDKATYRRLAEMPEQDAFFRQMVDHLETGPTWEDVETDIVVPE